MGKGNAGKKPLSKHQKARGRGSFKDTWTLLSFPDKEVAQGPGELMFENILLDQNAEVLSAISSRN